MKKIQLLLCFAALFNTCFAINTLDKKNPTHRIHLKTKEGNSFKGLLLSVNDTSLIAYPGKWKEWHKGKKYKPVKFNYSHIEEVTLKEKGRIAKGMAIGGAAGSLPLIAGKTDVASRSAAVNVLLVTVPAGVIAGAVVAGKSGKRYWINGNKDQFINFIRSLW